ncbi:hypothetical protein [Streptomyces sp. CBMA29]|uniref:hypothetical protein n=1 Tax=Streptomyces sp. CBMA29 TaxID=1896314 RepID=UPI0016619434|nr:hypothetical protein [Streptomyces sp. CBMA29]
MLGYSIQHFHDAGVWQTLGAYQGYAYAATAMRDAVALGSGREGRFAYPLGLRVVGSDGWKSQVLAGRQNIHVLHNPLTDQWVSGCRNCPTANNGYSAYAATEFARRHVCGREPEPEYEGRTIQYKRGHGYVG